MIFAAEKRTAELERQTVQNSWVLPNAPEKRLKAYIDLCPDIQQEATDGTMVKAIQMIRDRVQVVSGSTTRKPLLSECKDGIRAWRKQDHDDSTSLLTTIDASPSVQHILTTTGGSIALRRTRAVEELRSITGCSSLDGANAIDEWVRTRIGGPSW